MILVVYRTDGIKLVAKENATRADLTTRMKFREKAGWDCSRLSPNEVECTHERMPYAINYVLRPNNWPINNGEPQ